MMSVKEFLMIAFEALLCEAVAHWWYFGVSSQLLLLNFSR